MSSVRGTASNGGALFGSAVHFHRRRINSALHEADELHRALLGASPRSPSSPRSQPGPAEGAPAASACGDSKDSRLAVIWDLAEDSKAVAV
jgi:hypothetical protein